MSTNNWWKSEKEENSKFLAKRCNTTSQVRANSVRSVMLPNFLGIVPVNSLIDNDKILSFLHFSKFGGITPPRMFSER